LEESRNIIYNNNPALADLICSKFGSIAIEEWDDTIHSTIPKVVRYLAGLIEISSDNPCIAFIDKNRNKKIASMIVRWVINECNCLL
jgi:hypothetical protein